MRISRLIFITTLFTTLHGFSLGAHAADGAIKLKSIAQMEMEMLDKDGKRTVQRTGVVRAIPGTEVIYTTTFENIIDKPVGNIVINNPIPNDSEYKVNSAWGKDCEILFSVDGGKTFVSVENLKVKTADGKERPAQPKEYTHIRWIYKNQLGAGKTGEVGFRAIIK